METPFLVGEGIYLRPLERADAPLCAAWLNHPEVRRHLLRHRPVDQRSEEDFLDGIRQSEHDVVVGIALAEGDRLIGMTGLHQIHARDRGAMFGLCIGAVDEWGRGRGTEATRLMVGYAFDTLNLHRVWLHVQEDNAAGIRAYEKVGFRREGVLRQASFHDGRYWDVITMGLLREERPPR